MTIELIRRAGLGLVLAAGLSFGQTPAPAPAFEVASVKPAPPLNPMMIAQGKMHIGMKVDGARVDIGSLSLSDLIRIAYKIKSFQITGPDWMSTERFDILAKMPEGATEEQVPEMLQALLADRFKLTIHRENKEQPIYALVVAKGGHKMKDAPPDEPTATAEGEPPGKGGMLFGSGKEQMRISGNMEGKGMTMQNSQMGKIQMSMGPNGAMHMESSKTSMPALAEMLTRFVDRPIVDMTELKGNFQVALDLSLDEIRNVARAAGMAMPGPMGGGGGGAGSGPIDAASDPSANTIFASVQQLGLKLEARKSPVEKIVVDHVEKAPTEN